MKKKVLITTSSFDQLSLLDGFDVIMNPYARRLSEKEIAELLEKHNPDALLAGVEPLTKWVLDHSDKLRIISRCGVGMDSIDLRAAEEKGIALFNTPDAPAPAVAEMALALMLSSLRNIPRMDAAMKKGDWIKKSGGLLGARCIGIAGCGRIGTLLAKLLKPFGSKILGYDPYIDEHPLCEMVSFEELLERSDVLSLHLPLNEKTRGIIDRSVFGKMKKGALLVNTSRGGVIHEQDLHDALKAGRISAALDVFADEPYKGPLADPELPVILSPHQGSSALETRIMMERESAEHVVQFFADGGAGA